ncbi:MAG: transporter substrate-binding domain-containing protein [Alphaproteobacteria bacterium]|nr:transporter substrate-binding domain-containing protein [Alphaproteobacteria bacterium]
MIKSTLILLLNLVPCGLVKAADNDVWPADRPVRVGTITNNPPYVLENPSAGIDLDLVAEAFARVGLKVEFHHAPLSRVQVLLETGKVDAMTTFRTNDTLCTNSVVFSHWHDGITVPRDIELEVKTVQDLAGLRVGMFPGAVKVLDNLSDYDISSFAMAMTVYDRNQLIKVLLYRRLDAYIGDYWALDYAFRQLAPDTPKPYRLAVAFEPTPRRLCVRNAALVERFNQGVAAMLADGTPERVRGRYLSDTE